MKNDKEMGVQDQLLKPRKPKAREVSSRFLLSSPSSTPTHESSSRVLSPTISSSLQKTTATFENKRHQKAHELDSSSKSSNLWPSATGISYSSRQKIDTLADHLGIERLKETLENDKDTVGSSALFLNKQRSCRETTRSFESDPGGGGGSKKENHRPIFGGSMRYTKNLIFSGNNSPASISGRFSVDGIISKSDLFPDSESECSDMSSSSSRKSGIDIPSRYMNNLTSRRSVLDSPNHESSPKPQQKFTIKGAIKRASGASQWALSPGRTGLSPVSSNNNSSSRASSYSAAMKPPTSPSKQKGVEKLLNMGLDLFKMKKSSSPSMTHHDSGESVHQIRLLHNRLIQWRTVNARASVANQKIEEQAERNLICGWGSVTKLRHSVVQKRLQLEKRRLEMKLNFILRSQMKVLEEWREMEGRHCSGVLKTGECLNSVVCRVPLKDGAVGEAESTSYALRHASDLTSALKLYLNALAPPAEEAMPMMMELAKVVSQEKLLMEECLEHISIISTLQVQEWSLVCSLLQLQEQQQ